MKRSVEANFLPFVVESLKARACILIVDDNRDAAVEFIAKEMQLKPAHALKGWEYYTQNRLWPVDGEPNIEGMKHNLRVYAEQNGAKAAPPDVRKFVPGVTRAVWYLPRSLG
jgi:hypothetical protein